MKTQKPVVNKSRKRQSFSDLSIDDVRKNFNLKITRPTFFKSVEPIAPSLWLQQVLEDGFEISSVSEKARSEFIVAPILLYIRELHQKKISIYSGVKFDVDPAQGLRGICDFVLSRGPLLPTIQAPALLMVEAKKNDIEEGLGQCSAEMIAAQIFNHREGNDIASIYGCVTTGESWQFLRLTDNNLEIDKNRYFITQLQEILGILNVIVKGMLQNT